MNARPEIRIEDDASLAVLMLANWLRLVLSDTAGARLATGTFAVTSSNGQSVTVSMRPHTVNPAGHHILSLETGISDQATLLFRLDFDNLGNPDYKPVIAGKSRCNVCNPVGEIACNTAWAWLRHPRLMRQIRKLLALPFPHWKESAARFWTAAATLPDMPGSLLVVCSDEEQSLTLGEGEPEAEIVGKSLALARLFACHSVITQELYIGRLRSRASSQHLAGLSNAGLELMLGGER